MNEQELIELIQDRLPEELTAGQIAELRAVMRDSPALRDALLDEIRLEQSLATRYAPHAGALDEVVGRIERRAAVRRRLFWLRVVLAAGAAMAVAIGLAAALYRPAERAPKPPPTLALTPTGGGGAAATQPAAADGAGAQAGGAGVAGAARVTGSGRDPGGMNSAPPSTVSQGGSLPPEGAAEPNAPAAAPPPPPSLWATLEEPLPGRDVAWMKDFARLLQPAGGSPYRLHSTSVELRGRYRVLACPSSRRLVRLAGYEWRSFAVECYSGGAGVRISAGADGALSGFTLTRHGTQARLPAGGGQVVRRLVARDFRWGLLGGEGPADLRWQDGRIIFARGDVPLLRLPLAAPPEETYLDGEGKLAFLQPVPCAPLKATPAPPEPAWQPLAPAELTWTADRPAGAALRKGDDGSVELTGQELKEEAQFSAELSAGVGRETCFRVADAAALAGFQFRCPDGRDSPRWYLADQAGQFALVPDPRPSRYWQAAADDGLLVGGSFFLRVAVLLDYVDVGLSRDGNSWVSLWQWRLPGGAEAAAAGGPRLALLLHGGKGRRSIRLAEGRTRTLGAIAALADAKLVAAVPRAESLRAAGASWPAVSAELLARRPRDAGEWQWRLACAAAAMQRAPCGPLAADAAADALRSAAGHVEDANAALAAAEEFARETYPQPPSWQALLDTYDDLAAACQRRGRGRRLGDLMDSWLSRTAAAGRWRGQPAVPGGLVQLLLYDLLERADWRALRTEAARLRMLSADGRGGASYALRYGEQVLRLADWAGGLARLELGDGGAGDMRADRWRHPLDVRLDRETMNVIAEFLASVKAGAYEHAAKVLAEQVLPDAVIGTDDDDALYQSMHVRLRQVIEAHPQIVDLLRRRYADVASVRLQRAIQAGDAETIGALAVQFHTAAVGDEALLRLADRELSMGNVLAAAAKYAALLERASPAGRPTLAAKQRLAAAMAGSLDGPPLREDVHLPGATIPAAAFEQLLQSLARSRSAGRQPIVVTPDAPPAPPPGAVRLTPLADIAADRYNRLRPFHRGAAWAFDGRRLIVRQRERLFALNLDGRVDWSVNVPLQSAGDLAPSFAPPLLAGGRAFLRLDGRYTTSLACFDLRDGKRLWQQELDEGALSDPILVNNALYVLTCQRAFGGMVDLRLHRVRPETGESAAATRLLRLRCDRRELAPGRLVPAGELLYFRTAATLACCDLLGEVRWARKLTFVPREVDRGLYDDLLPTEPIVTGRLVIAASPGCPFVEAVRADSGRSCWRSLQPELRRLVGLAGRRLILVTARHIEAMDPNSGALVWRVESTAEPEAVVPAANASVLAVTLDPPADPRRAKDARRVRRVRWLSAADGSVLREEKIADTAFSGVARLAPAGRDAAGIANYDARARTARLFLLQVR